MDDRRHHALLSHTASTYPYTKEMGSFLFVYGAVYPYVDLSGGLTERAVVTIPGNHQREAREVLEYFQSLPAEPHQPVHRTPVIAYGANANVGALTRKFVTGPGYAGSGIVPVTRVTLTGLDVVWSPHFVGNGALPATITNSPGTDIEVWITWLDDQQLQRMHDSESVTDFYSYGTLDRSCVTACDLKLEQEPALYVDCFGELLDDDGRVLAVDGIPAANRNFQALTVLEAMESICDCLDWRRSPYELILDNLTDLQAARSRESALRARARETVIDNYNAIIACRAGRFR